MKKPMSAANIAPFFTSQIPDYSMKLYDLLIVDLPEHYDVLGYAVSLKVKSGKYMLFTQIRNFTLYVTPDDPIEVDTYSINLVLSNNNPAQSMSRSYKFNLTVAELN